jgi:hypothetical protein
MKDDAQSELWIESRIRLNTCFQLSAFDIYIQVFQRLFFSDPQLICVMIVNMNIFVFAHIVHSRRVEEKRR